ncbi:hypothetical protein [Desulfoluna spongiiphila]|uniref:Uncharacterized protein n=1 Tax=Desulfoluna spongiiphila TaxID=419481 RepID=A0A1G5EAS4_9BACT|nr:hypothetical protein [Desulfoluna spongiiphila]SCY24089.1 hypothetical protein SAMN05216233_105270 [Desulfoluna spongiiphila]VVS91689.1 hypothetical protein DBB_12570 [Desulfoluna spongiiphila]
MAKKLVSEKGVDEIIVGGSVYMDGSIILTPGAKDVLRNKGVTIVYGPRPETSEEDRLEAMVADLLKKEYGITDDAQVKAVSSKVVEMIKNNA